MILEELENSFSEILAERRGTVVGSLLAACLRFRIKQREVCRALTRAINPDSPSPNRIVPRMLFLEGLAGTGRFPQDWKAPFGSRMSVLGCAMLQTAFSYPEVHILIIKTFNPNFSACQRSISMVWLICH